MKTCSKCKYFVDDHLDENDLEVYASCSAPIAMCVFDVSNNDVRPEDDATECGMYKKRKVK